MQKWFSNVKKIKGKEKKNKETWRKTRGNFSFTREKLLIERKSWSIGDFMANNKMLINGLEKFLTVLFYNSIKHLGSKGKSEPVRETWNRSLKNVS